MSLTPLKMSACFISVSMGDILQRPWLPELNTFLLGFVFCFSQSRNLAEKLVTLYVDKDTRWAKTKHKCFTAKTAPPHTQLPFNSKS